MPVAKEGHKDQKIERDLAKFDRTLKSKEFGYSDNTRRLYRWHAQDFLKQLQEQHVRPTDIERTAELYLKRLRNGKSRTHFLQACSSIKTLLRYVIKRPIGEDAIKKLQSAG